MADEDEGTTGPDIDPADMDDLGDLGGGDPDDDDAPEGEDDDKDWKPPSKSQWERAQRRLKRFAEEKRQARGPADVDKELARQLGKGRDDNGDETDQAGAEEAARWRTVAARQSAAAELAAAGFSGNKTQATRLTRLLDVENAKPNRDGVFDFEDEIEDLKEEFPELFGGRGTRRNERRTVPGVRTAPANGALPPKDPSRKTSDALLKSAGYI